MPTFGEVKIKELPSISMDDIKDTDVFAIDSNDDTYSATVNALKAIFSSDDKILAMQETLTDLINKKCDDLNQLIDELSKAESADKNTIKELSEYMEKSKKDILDIKNTIVDMKNDISNIQNTLTTNTTDISNLQKKVNTNTTDISNLQKKVNTNTTDIAKLKNDVNTNTTDISNIQKTITKNKEDADQKIDDLVKSDGEIITQAKDYTDEKYDELMGYIDRYHHIYPIGTLYHTTDKDGDVKDLNNFGEWRLVAQITLSSENNIVEYVFERIK